MKLKKKMGVLVPVLVPDKCKIDKHKHPYNNKAVSIITIITIDRRRRRRRREGK